MLHKYWNNPIHFQSFKHHKSIYFNSFTAINNKLDLLREYKQNKHAFRVRYFRN